MNSIKSLRGQKKHSEGVLFLQGVFKTDCQRIEDIHERNIIPKLHKQHVQHDKIPTVFTTLESWPKSTNLFCCYCHRQFTSIPWFEPQSIEPISIGQTGKFLTPAEVHCAKNEKRFSIIVRKVFCTENCAIAYITHNTFDICERLNKIEMLKFVYYLFTGKNINNIKESPDPTEMIQYGGNLTPEEYQKKIDVIRGLADEDENLSVMCSVYLNKLQDESM
jgi:hypothetical protein